MSHYAVLAIIRKDVRDRRLRTLLSPYYEGKKVKPYVFKTKAQLIAEEIQEIEKHRRSHEAALKLSEEEYSAIVSKEDLYRNYEYAKEKLPDGYDSIDLTDEDAVFKQFKKERPGRRLNKNGDLIETYNPKSKWDWYAVGGRWPGQLRLTNGAPVDSALSRFVDWDAMFAPKPMIDVKNAEFWDEYVLGKIPEGVEDEDEYLRTKFGFIFYRREYYLEFYGTREEYVRRMGIWHTFAVVDEKGWHEPGEMGWFGCSGETPESKKDWEDNFRARFIDTLDPDDKVTIVDCHI